jgi:hypothetical protein
MILTIALSLLMFWLAYRLLQSLVLAALVVLMLVLSG